MNKKEFLDTLGRRLAQQLSQEKVAEHVAYYDRYLTEKIGQGMSEQEALAQLGDPLLIARTIMDTAVEEDGSRVIYEEDASGSYQRSDETRTAERDSSVHGLQFSHRTGCLIAGIVGVLLLVVVLKLIGSVLALVLPIAVPVLLVLLVIEYFKKR